MTVATGTFAGAATADPPPPSTAASSRQAADPQASPSPLGGPTPAVLSQAIDKIRASTASDFWSMADAAVLPLDALWDAKQGGYVAIGSNSARGGMRVRTNAEMLLVHAHAAQVGLQGAAQRPERVEPLVRLLTGRM